MRGIKRSSPEEQAWAYVEEHGHDAEIEDLELDARIVVHSLLEGDAPLDDDRVPRSEDAPEILAVENMARNSRRNHEEESPEEWSDGAERHFSLDSSCRF